MRINLFLLPFLSLGLGVTSSKVTILHDPNLSLSSYSSYFNSLSSSSFSLSFLSLTNSSLPSHLSSPDSFDHLILFCPSTKSLPPQLSPQSLFTQLSLNKNIMFILSPALTPLFADFAREFSIDFDAPHTTIIDHFSYHPSAPSTRDILLLPPPSSNLIPFISPQTSKGAPILYRGIAHQVVPGNPLVTSVLRAKATSYSYDLSEKEVPTEENVFVAGSQASLISAFQATNDARVLWVGSEEMFGNELWDLAVIDELSGVAYAKSGNEDFLLDLTKWTFKEAGILELSEPVLALQETGLTPDQFRVGDKVTLNVSLKHSPTYSPTATPLQFSFSLLDPYLLLPLTALPSIASSDLQTLITPLTAAFALPQHHGVFTLAIDHRRAGYNNLFKKIVVTVTPPRHDEYPRFIEGAWPWYVASGSTVVAFLGVVVVWLTI